MITRVKELGSIYKSAGVYWADSISGFIDVTRG